ncbi:MAG: N-acetylmuramoyl-L-alanine amidase [Eubacterium sp.]|nr:N-acetylmuramoyl-L-alanine amidase [Eubacterium sp.]
MYKSKMRKPKYKIKLSILFLIMLFSFSLFSGCGKADNSDDDRESSDVSDASSEDEISDSWEEVTTEDTSEETTEDTSNKTPGKGALVDENPDAASSGDANAGNTPKAVNPRSSILISIDPGHQGPNVDMSDMEPNGPGSSEMKMKATGGTSGRFTGVPEYQLNLDISLKLRDKLKEMGYQTMMTREDNDTAISNSERACLANDAGADISIRIHANGADDSSVNGALGMVCSPYNPYCSYIYDDSYRLADCVLSEYINETGLANQGIVTTDTMTGINWSTIPVMILEMGYMTNEYDDTNMQDSEFQERMVTGIVNGIERYFELPEYNPDDYSNDSGKGTKSDGSNNSSDNNSSNNAGSVELSSDSVKLRSEATDWLNNVRNEGSLCSAYMKNLKTGEVIDLTESSQKAASIIKLFVAGAVYQHYNELLNYGNSSDDIEYLVKIMISVSDNDACNSLVRMLGNGDAEEGMYIVNSYIASLGYTRTSMGRLMLDFDSAGENYIYAAEVGDYLELLYNSSSGRTSANSDSSNNTSSSNKPGKGAATGNSSDKGATGSNSSNNESTASYNGFGSTKRYVEGADKIISYMKMQEYTEKIPSVLPSDVVVANKTGDLVDTDNDCAIVYGPDAHYIICVFADELTNTATSSETIKQISSLTYDCWN